MDDNESRRLSTVSPLSSVRSRSGQRETPFFIPRRPVGMSEREASDDDDQHETASSSTAPPQGWPKGPQMLREVPWRTMVSAALSILLTFFPAVFLTLGLTALRLHHRPRSSSGDTLFEACKLGTTAFPIVFAAVVSKLMRALALQKCEQGSSLGFLEQLVGSQNLASTVENFVALRRFDKLGISILVLWLLSPIGSQLSLHMLSISDMSDHSPSEIRYFNVTTPYDFDKVGPLESSSDLTSSRAILTGLVSASMLASENVTRSSQDQWGNLKIPLVDEVGDFQTRPENDWVPVNQVDDHDWASLSGLMMVNLPNESMDTTFTIETSYFNVSCADSVDLSADDLVFEDLENVNASALFSSGGQWNSLFIDTWKRPNGASDATTINLALGSAASSSHDPQAENGIELYNCTMNYPLVETKVTCHGNICRVIAIRRSENYGTPLAPLFSPENTSGQTPGSAQFSNLLSFIPGSLGFPPNQSPSQIEGYLRGSDLPFSISSTNLASPRFASIPGKVFAKRLTTVINTVWQASMCPLGISLGPWVNFNDSIEAGLKRCPSATTAAKSVYVRERAQYTTNKAAAIFLLLTSFILELCAIAAIVLKYMTKAPDILGYISTMTRNNEYVNVPEGGNTLSGIERACHLAKLKVRLGDVRPGDDVGHIALATMDEDGKGAGEANGKEREGRALDRRRLYY